MSHSTNAHGAPALGQAPWVLDAQDRQALQSLWGQGGSLNSAPAWAPTDCRSQACPG